MSDKRMIEIILSTTIAMVSGQQSEKTNSKDTVEDDANTDTVDKNIL